MGETEPGVRSRDRPVGERLSSTGLLRAGLPYLLAALVSIVLCLPVMRFSYAFDDYNFLNRAALPQWSNLLPDSSDTFYRPVSREIV